jgi:hypothetical protein
MGKGPPGVDLENPDHLNARDLDLFGEGSMFELLCDVGTPAGRDALARWLQTPAPPEEVISRQRATRSLTDRSDLRQKLARCVKAMPGSIRGGAFVNGLRQPPFISHDGRLGRRSCFPWRLCCRPFAVCSGQ